jgi:WD40 repeat protein
MVLNKFILLKMNESQKNIYKISNPQQLNLETRSYECKLILDGHKDWVRDVAWCPSLGNPYDLIATCSEVHF